MYFQFSRVLQILGDSFRSDSITTIVDYCSIAAMCVTKLNRLTTRDTIAVRVWIVCQCGCLTRGNRNSNTTR